MDKGFMLFIAIGGGFLYFVINYIGGIQEEDESYQNNDYNQERKYDQYKTVDSIGQSMLDLTSADAKTQVAVWNSSLLKEEFTALFPNFSEMKFFLDDRIRGKILHDKLTKKINNIEDKFFSGTIDAEQAKKELGSLK